MSTVKFNCDRGEYMLILKIVQRFEALLTRLGLVPPKRSDLLMDVAACHSNGCSLKLQSLLDADDANFLHDVAGIVRHIDRTTGKLGDCFVPRYALG